VWNLLGFQLTREFHAILLVLGRGREIGNFNGRLLRHDCPKPYLGNWVRDLSVALERRWMLFAVALTLSTIFPLFLTHPLSADLLMTYKNVSTTASGSPTGYTHRIWTDKEFYQVGDVVLIHIEPPVGGYGVGYGMFVLKPDGSNASVHLSPRYPAQNATYLIEPSDPAGLYRVELWGRVIYPGATPTLRAYCYFTVAQSSTTNPIPEFSTSGLPIITITVMVVILAARKRLCRLDRYLDRCAWKLPRPSEDRAPIHCVHC
jgi:hypothetical protein